MRKFYVACAGAVLLMAALATFSATPVSHAAPPAQGGGDAARGAIVFAEAAGCGCHTDKAGFLAGGRVFQGPFGTVYSRNITPDKDTGIGNWTDAQIKAVLRTGKDDEGHQLFPIMPYAEFSGMSEQDANDLIAYLRTVPAVKNAVPENKLNGPVPPFTPRGAPPATAPTEGVARGAYLVNNVSLCNDCHTPANADGSPDMTKMLAGQYRPDLGGIVPNITSDSETGIGKWTAEQIAAVLKTGLKPDGKPVGGAMAEAVQGFKNMPQADALAIASYIKTVPAVKNSPQAPPGAPTSLPSTGGDATNQGLLSALLGGASLLLLAGGLYLKRRSQI